MTFTTTLKDEMSKIDLDLVFSRIELEAFIKCCGKYDNNNIIMTMENASVARKIYKDIKKVLNIAPNVTIRVQKRFRVKQIYILSFENTLGIFNDQLNYAYDAEEERIAFLFGAFLAVGNISNPQTSGYHLEFICSDDNIVNIIKSLLESFNFNAKVVKRGYRSVVYLKAAESISDLLKLFGATNSMFFFEDVRIYRDHKNMVNRLNNCEISNQTKSLEAALKQINDINYLREHDLLSVIDDKTKIVIEAREKYPEVNFNELAQIISLEYSYQIGKSGVNHHFIKIANMVNRHKENNK